MIIEGSSPKVKLKRAALIEKTNQQMYTRFMSYRESLLPWFYVHVGGIPK